MAVNELETSYQSCLAVTRRSGSNFVLAFRTLPRTMFREMCVLYAFMRHTDDLADDPAFSIVERRQRLSQWEDDWRKSLRGESTNSPLLPAVADLVRRRGISPIHLEEVIRGVQADLEPREFRDFPQLDRYCYQVAGAVGLCCLPIWGYRGELPREAALACGTAFQLTNILRDLREDARQGRVYLPSEDLRRFQVSPSELDTDRLDSRLRPLLEFQAARAWGHYRRALPLEEQLLPAGRRIFRSFVDLYAGLLTEIERRGFDVFSRPVRVSKWRKGAVLLRCLLRLPRDLRTCVPAAPK